MTAPAITPKDFYKTLDADSSLTYALAAFIKDLFRLQKKTGCVFAKDTYIAKVLKKSVRSVQRHLKKAEELGYIRRHLTHEKTKNGFATHRAIYTRIPDSKNSSCYAKNGVRINTTEQQDEKKKAKEEKHTEEETHKILNIDTSNKEAQANDSKAVKGPSLPTQDNSITIYRTHGEAISIPKQEISETINCAGAALDYVMDKLKKAVVTNWAAYAKKVYQNYTVAGKKMKEAQKWKAKNKTRSSCKSDLPSEEDFKQQYFLTYGISHPGRNQTSGRSCNLLKELYQSLERQEPEKHTCAPQYSTISPGNTKP